MIIKIRSCKLIILSAIIASALAAAVFAQQTVQSRAVRPAAISGDLLDMANANDDSVDTRAASGKKNYSGMSFTIDVGGEQNIIGVSQNHGRWPTHFPGAYKVEVALSPQGPWVLGWEGAGQRGESKAKFDAIRARYIRVTATAVNTQYNQEWSIAELRAGVDPGQTPRIIPQQPDRPSDPRPPDTNAPPRARELSDAAMATDGKKDTYASSRTPDYAGMTLAYDLGGEFELSRVIQLHGDKAEDYPGEYKIEVSRERNESKFREVWRGRGEPGRSVARFDPVVTRFVRITALRNRDRTHSWSVAELRTNRDEDVVADDDREGRAIRAVTANGFSNINAIADSNNTTRATTGNANYAGAWVQVDLGGSYTVSRVVQVHEPDERDFPGRYRIEVSLDGKQWQKVFEGDGERSRSGVSFNPVRARFIRITAIANHDLQHFWSIYNLRVLG
ncbi:MAG TPA: discoidin domain-containing protein [Blastocatellia bacterium]|nr:discoidin domain-containing protein [Blastocatellia bacterium]